MLTLQSIAKGIEPKWDLNKWFQWPPNIFALTSIILQRTGCYKYCLENDPWYPKNGKWEGQVNDDAIIWLRETNKGLFEEKVKFDKQDFTLLKTCYIDLYNQWISKKPINLNDLRAFTKNDTQLCSFASSLITIHAIADCCCSGVGLISQDLSKSYLFKLTANLLLNTTGSLSTISKFHGTVLPKMRTPQAGIVLRSLTHHLTFHTTEVEVVWRTFPWFKDDKQSLNLMIVPYPFNIHKTDFEVVNDTYQSVRYFKGKISSQVDFCFLDSLVEEIWLNNSRNNEVDLLVFPEMALSEKQYNYLLNSLSHFFTEKQKKSNTEKANTFPQLPIVISGVLHAKENNQLSDEVHNEVRMATFFAGKWYDITQRKHHRWQLDRSQLMQYGLEGYFPTERKWFELCSIVQRRLTILAPNSWLAFTSLICEDLARQEPVGEVIRGIGVPLLLALLSDGPQITSRWSSRYASVLADDPGTSVLSITSKGMASRSRRIDATDNRENGDKPVTVGLWKDMIKGWKQFDLSYQKHALMFTISSQFETEYSLDGRSDGDAASVFRMDSINAREIALNTGFTDQEENLKVKRRKQDDKLGFTKSDNFGDWHNIRMLSALTFTVDAILDLLLVSIEHTQLSKPEKQDYTKKKKSLVKNVNPVKKLVTHKNILETILQLWDTGTKDKTKNIYNQIKFNIAESWITPASMGISAITNPDATHIPEILNHDITVINSIINDILQSSEASKPDINMIINACVKALAPGTKEMANQSNNIALIFLYNLNTKISGQKSEGINQSEIFNDITISDAMKYSLRIKKIIKGTIYESDLSSVLNPAT